MEEIKGFLEKRRNFQMEITIEQILEYKFGRFEKLNVKCFDSKIQIEAIKEGVSEEDITKFLDEVKKETNDLKSIWDEQ